MSIVSASVAQSLAGLSQAERVEARERAKAEPARPARRRSERDEVVVDTQSVDAVRNLKDNTQEEAHEDRQGHAQYRPNGTPVAPPPRTIDIEG